MSSPATLVTPGAENTHAIFQMCFWQLVNLVVTVDFDVYKIHQG